MLLLKLCVPMARSRHQHQRDNRRIPDHADSHQNHSVGVGAKTMPGAAERMLRAETTIASHIPHRLRSHKPMAAATPRMPKT
jgi:hypothetical protein